MAIPSPVLTGMADAKGACNVQQQTPQEKIREAHALAQSIPYALTTKCKQDLKLRVLALLLEAMK